MTDTKLISLLKKLDPEEFRELEKFAASPFFARGREFTPLYKALKQFYPGFNDPEFTKESIFTKIYPKEKYSLQNADHKIRILFSAMYKLCLDFLVQLELRNDGSRKKYYLLNQLRLKKINKDFQKISVDVSYKEQSKGSIYDFIDDFYFETVYRDLSLDDDDFASAHDHTLSIGENLVAAALIKSLRNSDEKTIADGYNVKTRNDLMTNLISHTDIESLLEKMKTDNARFYPFVLIYYKIHKLNTENENKHYDELKVLLETHEALFSKPELYVLWSIMATYCSRSKQSNTDKYSRDLFYIYNKVLSGKMYKQGSNEDFHIVLFRNMVIVAMNLDETDWLRNLIETYIRELHPDHRENMKHFSIANLYYSEGDLTGSLEHMTKIRLDLFLFKLDVRILQLKIYYELNYTEQAYSLHDSLQHFIKNSKEISDVLKDMLGNFLKYYKKILRLSGNHCNQEAVELMLKEVIANKSMMQKDWLVLKLGEMIER